MNQTQIKLLRDFYTECLRSGYYGLTINGKEFALHSVASIEEIIDAILMAPKSVQEFRLKEAEKYISTLC